MRVLLVNPPVYDFALHDFWLKPYGLLRIASSMKKSRIPFVFFDFLSREHRFYQSIASKSDAYGRGKYYFEEAKKPEVLSFVPRKFKRYGIPLAVFLNETANENFDYIFITTGMTYWYPGVKEIIDIAKLKWPTSKIVIGGIAATLMPDFYKELGADIVVEGDGWESLQKEGFDMDPASEIPDYDVYEQLRYAVVRITEGCPLRCAYCASYKIKPKFRVLDVEQLAKVVVDLYYKKNVCDFVFYDDALLYNFHEGLYAFFRALERFGIIGKVRFHTPNALHVRKIDAEIAEFLKRTGFETIYLGVETVNSDLLKSIGEKLSFQDFRRAIDNLLKAGFSLHQITAYLFLGVPGQQIVDIEYSIKTISSYGVKISLSEFSPIPGTPIGDRVIREYNLKDPLLTNNSVFPIILYGYDQVNRLKNLKNQLMRQMGFST
ncbi:MAG: radical SAM protein [candidate division WOR-3 bacterium]